MHNEIFGDAVESGYTELIHVQTHGNVTFFNNTFNNMQWSFYSFIYIEQFPINCPNTITTIIFENNVIITSKPIIANNYFQAYLSKDSSGSIIIRNNTFIEY
jgi:hypothetical protein